MSQLQTVLRRSVAHLDPSDHDGRERTFTNAREAMIRLLWSYDPPLTPREIDSKIDEFDAVVAAIVREGRAPETETADSDGDEPSSLVTPEPDLVAAPAALPFSPVLALPPREPLRKLARFEPLSQIGSPTPAKDSGPIKIAALANAEPDAEPSPDAAVIAALAALDQAAGIDKKPAKRDDAGAAGTSPIGKTEPAEAAAIDARAPETDDEDDWADLDEPNRDEDAQDDPADEDLPEDETADEEATDDPDLDEDGSEPLDEDEDTPLDDDDRDDLDQDDDGQDDDGQDGDAGDDEPESAEEILRLHRERFDDRANVSDDAEDARDDLDDAPFDRDARDDEPLDEEETRRPLGERLRDLADAVSGQMIAIVAGVALLLVAALGGAAFFLSRGPSPATTASQSEPSGPASEPAKPTDIAGVIAASDPAPQSPAPARSEPRPEPQVTESPAGALALETLNLFDGRDPSVFQSMPDNPVRFEGDTQGGFARVSSSIHSTGSRITVGRGVYERLAGRTIRIVVVARATATSPAHSLRFAYQNGRSLSPWQDGVVGADYAPLSATWTVPRDRGGPETDAVLIEPGIPGDGTAADIKSVRIEVLK
ncbi:MAG: hypothetical protein P0Y66_07060 [Candidatus Kaistia colombiensis]|nr:MAG: hypothetical protein P0Y66_07060 [Kaistia sp.]